MAPLNKKTKPPKQEPPVPGRLEEDRQLEEEDRNEEADLRNEILSLPDVVPGQELTPRAAKPTTDDDELPPVGPTPVGGKAKEEAGIKQPPEAITGPPPSTPSDIETDEQLDARLNAVQPRNKTEERGFGILKPIIKAKNDLARNLNTKLSDKEKEIKELREKMIPEDEAGRLREIEKQFMLREVESLPKWKKYDEQIAKIDEDAHSLLMSFAQTPEDKEKRTVLLKAITERGGIIKFSESKDPAGEQWKNEDGSQMTNSQWFRKFVYDKLDRREQNQFDALTAEAYKKQREKETAITEAKGKAKETLEGESKEFWTKFNAEANSTVAELIKKELPRFDFPLQPPEILPTDSKEEKERKEKEIEQWKKADEDVVKNTGVTTAKDRSTVGFKSAMYDILAERYEQMKKDLGLEKKRADDLQMTLDGIKESRKLRTTTTRTVEPSTPKEASEMSDEEALAASGFK